MVSQSIVRQCAEFIQETHRQSMIASIEASTSVRWRHLVDLGSEVWLDTGDVDAASAIWRNEFSGLTTNNTLLNIEIQKGIYDSLIGKASSILSGLSMQERIREIAFIINAVHGLKLVKRFDKKVSVELHTGVSDSIEETVEYARRYYSLCPSHFIVKVPLTPAGYIATRMIRKEEIPVNFTLGFSARHNFIAASISQPTFVNVFLGRLNAYFADNHLSDGVNVGERATAASQDAVKRAGNGKVRQIAASLRSARQVRDLAGVDVFTIPVKVADATEKLLDGTETSHITNMDYPVSLGVGIDQRHVRSSVLWDIDESVEKFVDVCKREKIESAEEIVHAARDYGCGDLFPNLSADDVAKIRKEGKIPVHASWQNRIENRTIAIDSLLNHAGLQSFIIDQEALDKRIASFTK